MAHNAAFPEVRLLSRYQRSLPSARRIRASNLLPLPVPSLSASSSSSSPNNRGQDGLHRHPHKEEAHLQKQHHGQGSHFLSPRPLSLHPPCRLICHCKREISVDAFDAKYARLRFGRQFKLFLGLLGLRRCVILRNC